MLGADTAESGIGVRSGVLPGEVWLRGVKNAEKLPAAGLLTEEGGGGPTSVDAATGVDGSDGLEEDPWTSTPSALVGSAAAGSTGGGGGSMPAAMNRAASSLGSSPCEMGTQFRPNPRALRRTKGSHRE